MITYSPIMEKIAAELNMSLEDFFILYMDIQSEASCLSDAKLREELKDLNEGEGMPLLYRWSSGIFMGNLFYELLYHS